MFSYHGQSHKLFDSAITFLKQANKQKPQYTLHKQSFIEKAFSPGIDLTGTALFT